MKYILGLLVAIIVLVGAFFWLNNYIYDEKQGGAEDYKNATYVIGNEPITLVNGRSERAAAPGSAEKIVTQYFGNNAKGDLNADSVPDLAFILTQSGGGSGTFYYAVVALQNPAGRYNGTNAVLLGDRIAPQSTEIRDGKLIANYADRSLGEPMSAQSSLGVSMYLHVVNGELLEE